MNTRDLADIINSYHHENLGCALAESYEYDFDRFVDAYMPSPSERRYRRLRDIYSLGINVNYAGE